MSNSVFPVLPGLKWDVEKVPTFRTAVQQTVGGREVRLTYQPYPIWRWTLAFEFLRETTGFTEFQTLAGFFTARQGAFDSFLYDDPADDTISASAPESFGTGDGTTAVFQLGRSLGTSGLFEPIYNLNGVPVIYKNGVALAAGADYNVSTTGAVTFNVVPSLGDALTWSGSWYWRVRFGDDSTTFRNFASLFWNAQQVSLVQVLGL